jgi:hypothetical protein
MIGALQIRRCTATPSADGCLFPPAPAIPFPPAHPPVPKISNREPFRLEIPATGRKQRLDGRSNREYHPSFQTTKRSPASRLQNELPKGINSPANRKRFTAHPSFLFRVRDSSTVYFHQLTDNSTCTHVSGRKLERRTEHEKKFANKRKKLTKHPPFLLRLKSIPTVYFLQFTAHFNRTMLRLRRRKGAPRLFAGVRLVNVCNNPPQLSRRGVAAPERSCLFVKFGFNWETNYGF